MQRLHVDRRLGHRFRRIAKDPRRAFQQLVAPLLDLVRFSADCMQSLAGKRWTSKSCASSIRVFSPLIAPTATLALKAGLWFRRGRLVMVISSLAASCCCCTENPLIPAVQFSRTTSITEKHWLDATYIKVRRSGRIVSVAAIVAVAVNLDGRREVLGVAIQPSEAEVFWDEFLRSLPDRGLRGVKLIIAPSRARDEHKGLKGAATKVLGARIQRCRSPAFSNAWRSRAHTLCATRWPALARRSAPLSRRRSGRPLIRTRWQTPRTTGPSRLSAPLVL